MGISLVYSVEVFIEVLGLICEPIDRKLKGPIGSSLKERLVGLFAGRQVIDEEEGKINEQNFENCFPDLIKYNQMLFLIAGKDAELLNM